MPRVYFSPMILLMSAAISVNSETLKLWPSELCGAKAHSKSSIVFADDNSIHVETGTEYNWPGATVYFKSKTYDLSSYHIITVSLRNNCERPLEISLSVKNQQSKDSSPGGRALIDAGKSGVLTVDLQPKPWILDKELKLVGMNGHPEAMENAQFDIRKTAELHIFVDMPNRPAAFTILNIDVKKDNQKVQKLLKSDDFIPFVDCFGQFRHDNWPGKIHSEAQLQQARTEEAEFLKNTKAPAAFNKWGGWAHGPKRQATGHFRTEKLNGVWWLVDPAGHLFFSHGVTCVNSGSPTGIQHREEYFEWLPQESTPLAQFYGWQSWAPHGFYKDKGRIRNYNLQRANMARKYGNDWKAVYKDMAHRRIRAWGLNTIANWSDEAVYLMQRTPYVVSLRTVAPPIEGSTGWWGKFSDPFHADFGKTLKKCIDHSKATVNDPWCIGYFVDNELSWGATDRALAEAALKSPATQPAKLAVCSWLKQKYTEISKLNQSWQSDYKSWNDFLEQNEITSSDQAQSDLVRLHEMIAAKYFAVIRDMLQAEAPNKLYLGCRFASGSPASFRVASRYCDVVSFNNYNKAVAKDIPEGSHDKPLINGEFHFGALDRGLFHTGLVAVKNQQERAQAYKTFVLSCLQHPRYVGTHWFQWKDQPLTGRGDGENYQIGFLTETDQPYPELVEAAREIGKNMYETRAAQPITNHQ